MIDAGFNSNGMGRDQELIHEALLHTRTTREAYARGAKPLPKDLLPGYTILREIRRGGQGVVFEATQNATHRRVAIKMLREGTLAGRVELLRFQREVAVLGHFRHPNIVRLYDGGSVDGRPYYIMDYVEGQPLDEYVHTIAGKVRDILILMRKVTTAVHAAHVKGIVHRDLKPTNIRVDENGEPHILDFGLAKLAEPNDWNNQPEHSLTMTGQFTGSLPWAAPEQIECADGEVDIRTDVYALGVILFHALTGRFPYEVAGPMRLVMDNILRVDPQRPSALCTGLDDDIDTIVLKCLNKNRERRYQSAGEVARDVERYLDGKPIEAKQDSTWYVLTRTIQRHRAATATVLMGLITLVAFLSTSAILYRRAALANADALAQAKRAAQIHQDWQANISVVVREIAKGLTRLPKSMALRNKLLETSLAAFGRLKQHGGESPEMLADWATTLVALSDMAVAVDQREEAMRMRKEALTIREGLVRADPTHADWNRDLAVIYALIGDLLVGPEQVAQRRTLYERTLAIDEVLIARQPDDAGIINNLAFDCERLGNLAKLRGDYPHAEAYFEKQHVLSQSLMERFPDKPSSLWAMVCSLRQLAAMDEQKVGSAAAGRLRLDALSMTERLIELDPENPEYVQAMVYTAVSVAADQLDSRSTAQLVRMEPLLRRFVEMEPENHDRKRDQAHYYLALSDANHAVKDFANAERYASRALDVLHSLPTSAYDNPDQLRLVLAASFSLAVLAEGRGDVEARSVFSAKTADAANRLEEKLGTDATTLMCLADHWARCNPPELCDPVRAESLARRSIELSHGVLPRSYYSLALALQAQGKPDDARNAANRALALCPASNATFRKVVEVFLLSLSDANQHRAITRNKQD